MIGKINFNKQFGKVFHNRSTPKRNDYYLKPFRVIQAKWNLNITCFWQKREILGTAFKMVKLMFTSKRRCTLYIMLLCRFYEKWKKIWFSRFWLQQEMSYQLLLLVTFGYQLQVFCFAPLWRTERKRWMSKMRTGSIIDHNLCSIFLHVCSSAIVCWPAQISSKFIGGLVVNRLIKYTNYKANGKGHIAVGSVLNVPQIIT